MDPPFIAVLLTLYLYVVLYVSAVQKHVYNTQSQYSEAYKTYCIAILSYVKICLQIKKITI